LQKRKERGKKKGKRREKERKKNERNNENRLLEGWWYVRMLGGMPPDTIIKLKCFILGLTSSLVHQRLC